MTSPSAVSPSSPAAAPDSSTSSTSTIASLDGDAVRDFDGVEVVVDRMSVPTNGATIDFADSIERQGFHDRQPERAVDLRLRRILPLSR